MKPADKILKDRYKPTEKDLNQARYKQGFDDGIQWAIEQLNNHGMLCQFGSYFANILKTNSEFEERARELK